MSVYRFAQQTVAACRRLKQRAYGEEQWHEYVYSVTVFGRANERWLFSGSLGRCRDERMAEGKAGRRGRELARKVDPTGNGRAFQVAVNLA